MVDGSSVRPVHAIEMKAYEEACAASQSSSESASTDAPGPRAQPAGGCVALLAPRRSPSVAAPLGWVLSGTTLTDLDSQLKTQFSEEALDKNPPLRRLRDELTVSTPADSPAVSTPSGG